MDQKDTQIKQRHDKFAPYWAIAMFIFGVVGLSPIWIDTGPFWNGYLLDMFGPAWNYILFRGLFTGYKVNVWTRFFTPTRTFLIFILVCFSIEAMQYMGWYDATFDPLDLLAYVSILIPLFILDSFQNNYNSET